MSLLSFSLVEHKPSTLGTAASNCVSLSLTLYTLHSQRQWLRRQSGFASNQKVAGFDPRLLLGVEVSLSETPHPDSSWRVVDSVVGVSTCEPTVVSRFG